MLNYELWIFFNCDRLTKKIDAQGNETKDKYDNANQLILITDGNDNCITYEYEKINRQTKGNKTNIYLFDLLMQQSHC